MNIKIKRYVVSNDNYIYDIHELMKQEPDYFYYVERYKNDSFLKNARLYRKVLSYGASHDSKKEEICQVKYHGCRFIDVINKYFILNCIFFDKYGNEYSFKEKITKNMLDFFDFVKILGTENMYFKKEEDLSYGHGKYWKKISKKDFKVELNNERNIL